MAAVHQPVTERSLPRRGRYENSRRGAARPLPKSARAKLLVLTRAIWILAGVLLGATAGWIVFRAFLTLITLD